MMQIAVSFNDTSSPTQYSIAALVVPSDPKVIAAFIKSHAPHVARVGLETGATATWLWTELNKLGLPVICIDARHAKAALKMQINKSDRNEPWELPASCNVDGTRRYASKTSTVTLTPSCGGRVPYRGGEPWTRQGCSWRA